MEPFVLEMDMESQRKLDSKRGFEMLPDDFQGEILDVPIGTAVFTAEKYKICIEPKF